MKLKKTLIFCILIFSIIFISEASAENKIISESDGTDWIAGSDSWKIGYVEGFIAGANIVWREFYIFENSLKSETDKAIYNKSLNEIALFEITVGQIKDGISDFYNDFSNRRIKIVDAIYVVKMQIEGDDPELIDSQIRYLKMQPIDKEVYDKCSKKYFAFRDAKKSKRNPTYKEIKNGDFSFEDLLNAGIFIDASDNLHCLFCHGIYK